MKEEIMKFESGDKVEARYNQGANGVYTIPVTGLYMMSASVVEMVPTGSFQIVPNNKKKWWKFWEQSYVLEEIYVPKRFPDGSNISFFKKGEEVKCQDTKFIHRIR